MSEVELKPCPFCGGTDLDYGIYTGTLRGFDYVECQDCGGKINAIHKPKLISAEELWNKRASEKHGKWILEREPDGKPYCFHCSICDSDFCHIGIETAFAFCPNCGAKMEEQRTNFEKIKNNMTVEKMVELFDREGACGCCIYADDDDCEGLECREGIKAWLKQEAEE